MKNLVEGHLYELANFEDDGQPTQNLQFIHKKPSETNPSELTTIANGTTTEDVINVLIDRMYYLQSKFPCRENAIAITKLEESLMWLNKRTEDRKKRNVEGKHLI